MPADSSAGGRQVTLRVKTSAQQRVFLEIVISDIPLTQQSFGQYSSRTKEVLPSSFVHNGITVSRSKTGIVMTAQDDQLAALRPDFGEAFYQICDQLCVTYHALGKLARSDAPDLQQLAEQRYVFTVSRERLRTLRLSLRESARRAATR